MIYYASSMTSFCIRRAYFMSFMLIFQAFFTKPWITYALFLWNIYRILTLILPWVLSSNKPLPKLLESGISNRWPYSWRRRKQCLTREIAKPSRLLINLSIFSFQKIISMPAWYLTRRKMQKDDTKWWCLLYGVQITCARGGIFPYGNGTVFAFSDIKMSENMLRLFDFHTQSAQALCSRNIIWIPFRFFVRRLGQCWNLFGVKYGLNSIIPIFACNIYPIMLVYRYKWLRPSPKGV